MTKFVTYLKEPEGESSTYPSLIAVTALESEVRDFR